MARSANPPPVPRLIFNSDGDSTTLIPFPPPITDEQVCRDIDEIAGTSVEAFTNAMGRGDDTFSHPTEFGEIYGEGVTDWPQREDLRWVRHVAEHTRALLDRGINIIGLLAQRAHERGMQFWPAMRMNDIHEDDSTRWTALRSSFKKEHPELLIGSPYPLKHGAGYAQDNFTWAFDYARDEVRERKLGLILETCERHDIDGFELDFQRGPWYFKEGEEQIGMPLMTDFARKIREGTARIARRKARPFVLMMRVPPTIEKCHAIGLDVPQWIKEDLADVVALMDKGYLDMSADVAGFVDIARGTNCRIGAGLEHIAKGYGYAGADMLYAAALSYWRQGASCIYLFNYDCHRMQYGTLPYTPEEIRVLTEIHDPAQIERKDKRYCVPVDMELRTQEEGGAFSLPLELREAGETGRFMIHVGDDMAAARRDGVLGDVWLRITYHGSDVAADRVAVSLNGQPLPADICIPAPSCTTATHRDVPVVQARNDITIELKRSGPTPLRIEGIELVITYKLS